MNEDKNGQSPQNDPLDRWIEQTLQTPVPSTPAKISPPVAPSPIAPKNISSTSGKPQQPSPSHHSTQPHRPASNKPPFRHNRPPFRKPQQHGQNRHPFPPKAKPYHPPVHPVAAPKMPISHETNSSPLNQNDNGTAPKKSFFSFLKRNPKIENHVPNSDQKTFYRGKLRIIPLGGLDEVGKNCMVLEYGPDIILIDMGFQFPEEDMLGVDYVIPDITYLEDKVDRIRGIIITHGHLDHIGAIPYLVPKLNFPPIYGTKLTMGLVDKRLEEFGLQSQSKNHVITADDTLQLGHFNISFFGVNRSIPDAVGVVVKTPAGNVVNTGDFKFDFTPSGDQKPADFSKIGALSGQNIAALFIDSTNALKPGYTISEKKIGDSLESIIKNIETRILIASFASQIGRMQQIIDFAKKYHRTIFLSGRSLIDNIYMASKLGYLRVPEGLIHDIRKVHKIPDQRAIILTTGSQGESVSALTRMAHEDHPNIKIKKGDTVVLSSSPIPGNERAITTVTNNLSRLGARIINNQIMDVHASGHAQQEDLKLMMSLVKAKNIVPIHGEYHMRFGNKEIAMSLGYDEKNAIMIENGGIIEIENGEAKVLKETVETKYILIDGLGVGDVGAQVMMDRQTLAENGVLIILIPIDEKTFKLKGEVDIISRGFIYMKESEELVQSIKEIATKAYHNIVQKRSDPKRGDIKKYIKESVDKFVHQKIERHPLVLPVILEK